MTQFFADLHQQFFKGVVAAQVLVANPDAREMRRDTGNSHAVKIRLNNRVGARRKHAKFFAPTECVYHASLSSSSRISAVLLAASTPNLEYTTVPSGSIMNVERRVPVVVYLTPLYKILCVPHTPY